MDTRKRLERRRHTRNISDTASTDSSSESSSSESSATKSTRRKKKNTQRHKTASRQQRQQQQHQQQQQQPDLTPEEAEKFIALDCEMVGIGPLGRKSALARVTLVDWNGNIVFDEYIQQQDEVTDYRTFVSGITPQILTKAEMTIDACRTIVSQILQDKILVGHGLKNDLRVIGIQHPWYTTRDTAKYEPFMKVRFDDGILWPRSLKDLMSEKLQKEIQNEQKPHSPYEDAMAALDLYRSVRVKWEKVMAYKVNKTRAIQNQVSSQ